MGKRRGTQTSTFGTSKREGHDSTYFYGSRLYSETPTAETVTYTENEINPDHLNRIFNQSAETMQQIPDNSVHLMVTSPPYNVRKDYDEDLTLGEYLSLLESVFTETARVLVPGGRACINVANVGRKPYIPLSTYISSLMIGLGFYMRGEIIWDKAASVGNSTAWGSWVSASNPTLRDVHEYILVFSKGTFKRESLGRESTIDRDEFLEYTKSVWSFPTESAQRIGHPAPFPPELPYRLIQLYTFNGEVVLDPFMGSGTTALSAMRCDRKYIGYEVDPDYIEIAQNRLSGSKD